jgi:cholesterol transport system auxiliary component
MRIALAASLLLVACGPIVQVGGNSKPPDSLLTLRAEPSEPAAQSGKPILVALPDVPGSLRTLRIPVATSATEFAYLAEASWIEQPSILFRRLLADTIESRSGRLALDERNMVAAEHRLSGRLVEFGLDVRSAPEVRVRFDAVLTRSGRTLVASRRFEASAPSPSEAGPDVARALNSVANDIARQVADWATANATSAEQ